MCHWVVLCRLWGVFGVDGIPELVRSREVANCHGRKSTEDENVARDSILVACCLRSHTLDNLVSYEYAAPSVRAKRDMSDCVNPTLVLLRAHAHSRTEKELPTLVANYDKLTPPPSPAGP